MTRRSAVAPEWRPRLQAAGVADPAELLDGDPRERTCGRWEALSKPGLGGRERWCWTLPDADDVLYVKRYQKTALGAQLDRVWRQDRAHSRAWWEYTVAADLAAQSVPAVRAIAVAEEMRGTFESAGVVFFEQVAGEACDRVAQCLKAADSSVTRGTPWHDLTRRLARFTSAFHQTGMCHRDLYLCHIFVDLDQTGAAPPRFTLIDLARTHRPRLRRTRWLIKDLSQLDVSARQIGASRTDRLRFLLHYFSIQKLSPRPRWFIHKITRKSDGILRRIARQEGRR